MVGVGRVRAKSSHTVLTETYYSLSMNSRDEGFRLSFLHTTVSGYFHYYLLRQTFSQLISQIMT